MRIAAAIAALMLCACTPPDPTAETKSAEVAPNITQASYRIEGLTTDDAGKATPMVMARQGNKLRVETATDQGPATIIIDKDAGEAFVIGAMAGQAVAMRMPIESMQNEIDGLLGEFTSGDSRQVGACSVAGEIGAEWEKLNEDGETERACLTGDGVFLRASTNGKVRWEASRVMRGPQSADLFAAPAGIQVMDMGAAITKAQ